jgi:hypothetical protein
MNLEHVVRSLDEQNKLAAEMLEMMKKTEERAVRSEERSIEIHGLACEVSRLAIDREKRMAAADAEHAERLKEFRNQIPIVSPGAEKKETN